MSAPAAARSAAAPRRLRPLSGQLGRVPGAARESLAAGEPAGGAPCEEIFDSVSGPFGTSLRARGGQG